MAAERQVTETSHRSSATKTQTRVGSCDKQARVRDFVLIRREKESFAKTNKLSIFISDEKSGSEGKE